MHKCETKYEKLLKNTSEQWHQQSLISLLLTIVTVMSSAFVFPLLSGELDNTGQLHW